MPEETKTPMTYKKVARKAYLYKNENKREGSRDPDYKSKLFDLELDELKDMADGENKVTLFFSGWIEEDQSGTSRVGISVQKGTPAQEAPVAAEATPF